MSLLPMGAYAAVTGLSFGGKYFYSYPCTCTGGLIYYIVVGPPSFMTLTYAVGTQAKAIYTLPFGRQIMGLYNPFITTSCVMGVAPYCTVIYSRGQIMPMVGNK